MDQEGKKTHKEKKGAPLKLLEKLLNLAHHDDAKFDDHQGSIIGNRLKKIKHPEDVNEH